MRRIPDDSGKPWKTLINSRMLAGTSFSNPLEDVVIGTGPRAKIRGRQVGVTPIGNPTHTNVSSSRANYLGPETKGAFLNKAGKVADDLVPFASNIMNAFRKPPMPKRGIPNSFVTLPTVSLQNERNASEAATTTAGRGAERSVDGNTAEAVKAYHRGTGFSQLSSINERENNINAGIRGQQAGMNAQIEQGNNAKVDEYNDMLTERTIAQQREQSANLANAGDKLMMIRNEKERGRVELEKARVLKSLYSRSGVLDRQQSIWDKEDLDPFGTKKKAYGGNLTRMRKLN